MVSEAPESAETGDRHHVGERLRWVRELNGLSQRELARRAGVPNSSVSMIEQGRVSPSLDTLGRLLDAIPISMAQFFSANSQARHHFFYRIDAAQSSVGEQFLAPDSVLEPLKIAQYSFPPGTDTGTSLLKPGDLCTGLLISGSLEVTLGGRIKQLEPGDGFYLGDQSPYRLRNSGVDLAALFMAYGRSAP